MQDESTELSFVDSDYSFNVSGADLGGFSQPPVTSCQDVDQWLHVSSRSQDAASLGLVNQEGVFDATVDSMPQSFDYFTDFDFSAPIIGMDSHPNDIDSSIFTFSSSPVPFLDLPIASDDMSKMASPTDSPNTVAAL
ncbi:hypothetical protein ACLX1H_009993 [Fusarium chlamydosporum]